MRLREAVDGYLLDVSSRGYSPHTIMTNKRLLCLMADYLNDKPPNGVTTDDLRRFVVYMQTEYKPIRPNGDQAPLGPAAMDNVVKAVHSFFGWADRELKIPRPDTAIKGPRYEQPEVLPYTEDEVKRIMKAATQAGQRKRKTGLRDALIIMILLDTGVRLGELARLRVCDLSIQAGEIHILPFRSSVKSRPRVIPIGASTKRAAWKYLHTRGELRPVDPLFATATGAPVTESQIQNLLYDIGNCAGVDHVGPHRFRHTFAIEYLRNGGDIFTLQRLLGHKSLEMVNYYLTIVRADLETVHRKASPVDHWKL